LQPIAGADGCDIGVGEPLNAGLITRKGDMHFIGSNVAGCKHRRVVQVFFVEEKLLIGSPQIRILALRLILPGKPVTPPHIRKASATTSLGQRLLKAVEAAFGVCLIWGRLSQKPAEVNKVFLGGGFLIEGDAVPLRDKGLRCGGRGHVRTL